MQLHWDLSAAICLVDTLSNQNPEQSNRPFIESQLTRTTAPLEIGMPNPPSPVACKCADQVTSKRQADTEVLGNFDEIWDFLGQPRRTASTEHSGSWGTTRNNDLDASVLKMTGAPDNGSTGVHLRTENMSHNTTLSTREEKSPKPETTKTTGDHQAKSKVRYASVQDTSEGRRRLVIQDITSSITPKKQDKGQTPEGMSLWSGSEFRPCSTKLRARSRLSKAGHSSGPEGFAPSTRLRSTAVPCSSINKTRTLISLLYEHFRADRQYLQKLGSPLLARDGLTASSIPHIHVFVDMSNVSHASLKYQHRAKALS